jgi:hypothetical protein
MVSQGLVQQRSRRKPFLSALALLGLALLLAGCQPGGNQGSLSPQFTMVLLLMAYSMPIFLQVLTPTGPTYKGNHRGL